MGPYCRYCDHRCFVERILPADAHDARGKPSPYAGMTFNMATCVRGMEQDRRATGYDHTTARNPRAERSEPRV